MKSDTCIAKSVLISHITILISCMIGCHELTNVALKKQAFQSSSEYTDAGGAELAVDGVTNQYWSGGSCTHTRKAAESYWEVDLGGIYVVDNVKVYTRMDSCCITFKKIDDASGTGTAVGTVFARTWGQCCYFCFKTAECSAVKLKDSTCSLLNSNLYEDSTGENIYILN